MKPFLRNLASRLLIFLLFFNLLSTVKAQTDERTVSKLYFFGAAGGSQYEGINSEIGLQAVVNNKWSATFSYQRFIMAPRNLPADYQPETGMALFLIPYENNIEVNMKLFSLTAGKYFRLARNIWFSTEAGVSLVKGEKASFQPAVVETDYYLFGFSTTSSNYKTTIEKKTTVGGMLRADINWAFASFKGLGAGVFANFNSIQSPIGLQLKLTLGLMGRTKKEKY